MEEKSSITHARTMTGALHAKYLIIHSESDLIMYTGPDGHGLDEPVEKAGILELKAASLLWFLLYAHWTRWSWTG